MNKNYAKNMEIYVKRFFIVMFVCIAVVDWVSGDSMQEQIPLVRLPSNTLLKYTAYKDVSILHFDIPADTRTAYFNFKAYEETKSAFRKYFSRFFLTLQKLNPQEIIQLKNNKKYFIFFSFPSSIFRASVQTERCNVTFKIW